MSTADVINVIAGAVSIVLGFFALFLSVYFFIAAKNAEKETAKALEAIKTQTDALQRLAGRQINQLTRAITEPRPYDELLIQTISSFVTGLPDAILRIRTVQATEAPPQQNQQQNEQMITELVSCYIGLYHYCATANVMAQALFSTINGQGERDFVQNYITTTHRDFNLMRNVLAQVHPSRITSNRLNNLHQDVQSRWEVHVRTAPEQTSPPGDG